jgi:sulfoxide reductase heme-binding subunit YedZ
VLNPTKSRWFYPVTFVAAATPLALLLYNVAPLLIPLWWPDVVVPWESDLGVNPAQTLIRSTGKDAFILLIASLAVTPIRRLLGWNRAQLVRRMLGVWSFAYGVTHLSSYVVFDKLGNVSEIVEDVFKRRFIFVGMFTFVILALLAATSTNGMMRRLGKRWQRLHRLVYVAAIAATVHFVWGQKADIRDPLMWAAILTLLLGIRVFYFVRKLRSRGSTAASH